MRRQHSPLRKMPSEAHSATGSRIRTKKVDTTTKMEFPGDCYLSAWHTLWAALMLSAATALILYYHVVPAIGARTADWWMRQNNHDEKSENPYAAFASMETLPGSYTSMEEMLARNQRFPSIDERVQIYMSNWYAPPCSPTSLTDALDTSLGVTVASSFVQYNYLRDGETDPLLVLREVLIPEDSLSNEESDEDDDSTTSDAPNAVIYDPAPKYFQSSNHRIFLLDSQALDRGARVFYLSADTVRRCGSMPCADTVNYLFPSLHRVDMNVGSVSARAHGGLVPSVGYPGNALDSVDGNRNGISPVLLQFGDLDVTRSFCPASHTNETFPAVPLFRKFRGSLTTAERRRVATSRSCYHAMERDVPKTSQGARRLQPST
jgi:hypothetical protein